MNIDLSEMGGITNVYDKMNERIVGFNPLLIVILSVIVILYFFIFSNVPEAQQGVGIGKASGLSILEIIMWGLLIYLVSVNALQFFFNVDINASIKNFFTAEPEIDIKVLQEKAAEQVTQSDLVKENKQVFNVSDNEYTYDEAKALCKAYDARLATYDEVEDAYGKGGEWCNYGWSEDQLALFPTQKETFKKLQKTPGHENDCGRPGVNGGFIANKNVRFGVNCYGYKPKITSKESILMEKITPFPITEKDKAMQKMVNDYKKRLPDILITPFNNSNWSQV